MSAEPVLPGGGEGEGGVGGEDDAINANGFTLPELKLIFSSTTSASSPAVFDAAIEPQINYIQDDIPLPLQKPLLTVVRDVQEAVDTNEIKPAQIVDALTWVQESANIPYFSGEFITSGQLALWLGDYAIVTGAVVNQPETFSELTPAQQTEVDNLASAIGRQLALWWGQRQIEQGPSPTSPSQSGSTGSPAPAPAQPPATISQGPSPPAPQTAQIQGPTVDPDVIAIIQATVDQLWTNVTAALYKVVSGVETQFDNVAGQITALSNVVNAIKPITEVITPPTPSGLPAGVLAEIDQVRQELHNLGAQVDALTGQSAASATAAADDASHATAAAVAPLDAQVQGLSVGQAALTLTTLTLGNSISAQGAQIGVADSDIATLKVAQAASATALQQVMQDVDDEEDCCEENLGVTQPIKAGGATPSLLKNLGSLLGKFFELGLLATLADTVLSMFEWDQAELATIIDTEQISNYATAAATAALQDISWSDPLKTIS